MNNKNSIYLAMGLILLTLSSCATITRGSNDVLEINTDPPGDAAPTLDEEIVIGRWCDRMVPSMPQFNRIVKIAVSEEKGAYISSQFRDSPNPLIQPLTKGNSGDVFYKVDSDFGDTYRIDSSTGALQMLDDYGLIRVARKHSNGDECLLGE